ncbi:Mth938-like domain-containing protein [Mesorhizobium sp. M7A.F.Ca.US.006.01.1.1]|uniref:Mth938-like domain-containing protein n=1 Tax=Mesorhizobium sp. M7A.F.Ca.US.006.01.1.1 TaxID=2496707 RepID=UPI0013E2C753|nr:Mth938-like domain-containing protein [Mesorhizobium sp. M7A.F.Ca.US.006.01.1.1]
MAARRSRPDAPGITVTSKGIVIREAHFPGRAPIEAYGNGGFRFADMSHRGSLMCLPSGIHGWEPADPLVLTVADFDRLLSEADKVELLLVGMGRDLRPLPVALRAALKAAGIASEPMSTGAAVRTYNVLLAEERAVAAALIAVD